MTLTHINISEQHGVTRENEHVIFSVPFAQNTLNDDTHLSIADEQGVSLVFEGNILNRWPNGSVRWLQVSVNISLAPKQHKVLTLTLSKSSKNSSFASLVAPLKLDKLYPINQVFPLLNINSQNKLLKDNGRLEIGLNGNKLCAYVEQVSESSKCDFGQQARQNMSVSGYFALPDNDRQSSSILRFSADISIHWPSKTITTQFCIHNPNAASHPAGLWDLGDPNSIDIDYLHYVTSAGNSVSLYDAYSDTMLCEQHQGLIHLTQLNSGGENFDCDNHVNKHNKVEKQKRGFHLKLNDKIMSGARVTPTLHVESEQEFSITLDKFWQNFPKSFKVEKNTLQIGLFPAAVELQAGEKKTHSIVQRFGENCEALSAIHYPLKITIDPNYLQSCHVTTMFNVAVGQTDIAHLVTKHSLQTEHNFFAKRECIDEYGWRNFGELYADHETNRYEGEKPFISHYNNQYDPINGFLQQFLMNGDQQWFELANDLAKHVVDIDIYHTNEDRDMYNNGLFWHTDHYNQAHTCTHRTYSKLQNTGAYGAQSGGGGPGGQHCYTTGLALHYCLTGNQASKQSVLQLTEWITTIYEGSGSLFDFALRFKNRNKVGGKNIYTNTYPLDRGTGNYIVALLDSFYLTNDYKFLKQAKHVIEHTISPQDNIADRNLDDPEHTWFYTVLLQATARYLMQSKLAGIKNENKHIHDAFVLYVNWMLDNEKPFLESADKLEFINATWVAQDLRKPWIFDACTWLGVLPEKQELLTNKSHYYKRYVMDYLDNSKEQHYTRIIVLLMQNMSAPIPSENEIYAENFSDYQFKRKSFASNILRVLKTLSITREYKWLKSRLG